MLLRADSRGTNCCLEIRTILNCDPVGECMGFNGDCGDILAQFSGVQGPYVYGDPPEEHMYLDEYVCTAFPDDAYITDQMLVGLISVAVALPVDLFLARAFELANEGDAPESWLEAPAGKWKLMVGRSGHNDWRLADPKQPISDLVLWLVRYSGEPIYATLIRLLAWLGRKLCTKLFGPEPEQEDEAEGGESASAGSREERADAISKHLYASLGLLGVYICWTIFVWCVVDCIVPLAPKMCADCILLARSGSSSPTACSSTRRWATAHSNSSPRCVFGDSAWFYST